MIWMRSGRFPRLISRPENGEGGTRNEERSIFRRKPCGQDFPDAPLSDTAAVGTLFEDSEVTAALTGIAASLVVSCTPRYE